MQHKTKFKVTHLKTGLFVLFNSLEDARAYALSYGDNTPLKLEYPIYM